MFVTLLTPAEGRRNDRVQADHTLCQYHFHFLRERQYYRSAKQAGDYSFTEEQLWE
jgi:hypothetical protein